MNRYGAEDGLWSTARAGSIGLAVLALASCQSLSGSSSVSGFICAGGKSVSIVYELRPGAVAEARVTYGVLEVALPRVVSGSGVRYSDNIYTWWEKGDEAFLERDEELLLRECTRTDAGKQGSTD